MKLHLAEHIFITIGGKKQLVRMNELMNKKLLIYK